MRPTVINCLIVIQLWVYIITCIIVLSSFVMQRSASSDLTANNYTHITIHIILSSSELHKAIVLSVYYRQEVFCVDYLVLTLLLVSPRVFIIPFAALIAPRLTLDCLDHSTCLAILDLFASL